MYKLTGKHLEEINNYIATQNGGSSGVSDREKLERLAESPYKLENTENKKYVFGNTVDKAAYLAYVISEEKPFEKFNYMTAALAAFTLLELNDYKTDFKQEDFGEFRKILTDKPSENTIRKWFLLHTERK